MTTHLAMSMFATKEDYMEARIKELQAALSTAEADRKALMEVARMIDAEDMSDEDILRDLRMAYLMLPAHLRSEEEGKGKP